MKRVANGGMWLPDNETDPIMIGAGAQYQGSKLHAALKLVHKARTAIDVGAHCGLWSVQLGNYFQQVECFEPLPIHIECWKRNAGWKGSLHLHEICLGNKKGECDIHIPDGFSGHSHVITGNTYKIAALDDFDFQDVDLVKIDCEGYEYYVCAGARRTLVEWKPVVIVEQKKGFASRYGLEDMEAVKYLESIGMRLRREIAGDFIMDWPE